MSDDERPTTSGSRKYPWGGMRWKILGEQIGDLAALTDRELLDLANQLARVAEDHYAVPERDRMTVTVELCEALKEALQKIGLLTRH